MTGYGDYVFQEMTQIAQLRLRSLLKMHILALMGIMAKQTFPNRYRTMKITTGSGIVCMARIT